MTKRSDVSDALATALASYGVAVGCLRRLQEKGLLDQADVGSVLVGTLQSLERHEGVGTEEAHGARVLLSGLAQDLGIPLRNPN